jgi:hypothetical protein
MFCRSTYAQRAKVVLKEKGIPYKVELINKLNKPQEFLDLFRSITSNPEGRGTVPIIVGELASKHGPQAYQGKYHFRRIGLLLRQMRQRCVAYSCWIPNNPQYLGELA